MARTPICHGLAPHAESQEGLFHGEPGGSCVTFYGRASEVIWCCFLPQSVVTFSREKCQHHSLRRKCKVALVATSSIKRDSDAYTLTVVDEDQLRGIQELTQVRAGTWQFP